MNRKYREYTYEDYKKAMDLHNKYKLGPRRISRILGISRYTINNWLYYSRVPPMAKWVAEPSIELAYIIGSLEDGCVSIAKDKHRYQYKIILTVTDPEFAETFSKVMSKLLNRKYKEPRWDNKRKQWRIVYKSKAFYLWYKKTKEEGLEGFKPYIEYSKETVRYYLRGLYDSEGNNKMNKQIRLYNSNIELLRYVQYLLEKYFDIKSTGPYLVHKAGSIMIINGVKTRYNDDYYSIQIGKKEYVQEFLEEIGFNIIRKQLGLKRHEKGDM